MSYSRKIDTTIPVSGQVSKNVNGEWVSVNYHEDVPIRINLFVDTGAFDSSIEGAGKNINGLTASIVGMKSAQVAEINRSSKKISGAMVDGFFNLINSDLTLQKSENNSELQAKMGLLLEFSKEIVSKHDRMNADFNRLKAHFKKVFDSFDEECAKLIRNVDRNVFDFSERVHKNICAKTNIDSAAFTLSELNENNSVNLLSIARLKKSYSDVIDSIASNLKSSVALTKQVESYKYGKLNIDKEVNYIPVVYVEKDSVVSFSKEVDIYNAEINDNGAIINGVYRYLSQSQWTNVNDRELNNIEQAFTTLVEDAYTKAGKTKSDNSDVERICKEIVRLWNMNKSKKFMEAVNG